MGHPISRIAVRRSSLAVLAAWSITVASCATETPPSVPTVPLTQTTLELTSTGLGPCVTQWYAPCNYGIRVEGANGYDHRGNFAWDPGQPAPGSEMAGANGPMASKGVLGDVPETLAPGEWTISFRRWYGSDAIQLVPVPGGTPRTREQDPFNAACSVQVDTLGLSSVTLQVAFDGSSCTVEKSTK
jgi:hypothetical protein